MAFSSIVFIVHLTSVHHQTKKEKEFLAGSSRPA
jgi:hypothetical protein